METVKIGKWNVPKQLFDKYIKSRMLADSYAAGTGSNPSGTDYERGLRWQMCVKLTMETHREICNSVKVQYSEDVDDAFYKKLQEVVRRETKLRG